MTQSPELQERLAFLDFGEPDRALLKELAPLLEKHAASFVSHFYRHLLSFEPTRSLLREPEVKERLLQKQRAYLLSLAGPELDDALVEERRRIGEVHERIGLDLRWYLGAYNLYLTLLTPLVFEHFGYDPAKAVAMLGALHKLLTFDAQLATETYIERRERELSYLAEELAKEGRRLSRDFRDQAVELRQSEERARASEQLASVATLVAGLAHEIGTPMSVIQGHAKLLERAVSGEDATWRLETIQEQIGRISRIIQTLLNMAHPRETARVPVALKPLLENTLSFLQEKLARRNILVKHALEDTPSVIGDGERLQQLFLNLVLNAADAMRDGGQLTLSLGTNPNAEIEVDVADTGAGIRPQDLDRVFDPFFTTKEAGQGNGLGLVVAKGIVGDHGGEIEVESTEGKGTVFHVRFPAPAVAGAGGD